MLAAVDPELLFVTNGISGALGLICSLFVGRGDTVVVEEPSYFLALSIFKDFGLNIVSVPLDENGMNVGVLADKLAGGLRPKLVYTIPAFHNPTGYSMSHDRKQQLVGLADQYNFTILADEVYQLLGFEGVAPPPPVLCEYDTSGGHVISMGSFAKILAPGMRLGWLQTSPAGKPLLDRIYGCGQLDSSGGINPVISGIVHKFITEGHQDAHLAAVRGELTRRAATLGDALRKYLPPGAVFIQPSGGYFIWIKLPDGVPGLTGSALLDHCVAHHKIRFHPGIRFGSGLEGYIRLSFSYYNADDLAVGAQRLGEGMTSLIAKLQAQPPAAAAAAPAPAPAVPKVAVHGATGRLGSLIVGCATTSSSSSSSGSSDSALHYAGAIGRDGPIPSDAGVVIDVSLPAGTAALLGRLTSHAASTGAKPLPLVIGTTGADLPWDAIKAYAATAPVVVSANFSVGVPLVLGMISSIKSGGGLPAGWSAEVTEIHHTAKRDAPSGTAKRLVEGLASAGVPAFGPEGTPIPTHALRLGDTVGVHTVYLAGPGERVEVTHTATRREVFALGALRLAQWAAGQPAGLYIK